MFVIIMLFAMCYLVSCYKENMVTYTAHKKFMNGFARRRFHPFGANISIGRCQKTLPCKAAK